MDNPFWKKNNNGHFLPLSLELMKTIRMASQEERLKSSVATVLEGSMVIKQKNELPVITVNKAVLCQTDLYSDKSTINLSDYWAGPRVCSFSSRWPAR